MSFPSRPGARDRVDGIRPGLRDTLARAVGAGRAARHRRLLLRRLVAVVALVAALALTADILRPDPPAARSALVAAHHLMAGQRLTSADLRQVLVPADLPTSARVESATELTGRVVATAVHSGELLTVSRLVPRNQGEGLPSGTAPLHVVVTDPRMIDLVGPGQRVRVHRARTGTLLAEDVLVVGVDAPIENATLIPTAGASERGLVLALPASVIDEALATPEPDGVVPRMHVVPMSK